MIDRYRNRPDELALVESMMQYQILLFAAAREAASSDRVVVELAAGATVDDLRAALAEQHCTLAALISTCRIAVDGEFASDQMAIESGMEIALIPPVSGG